MPSPAASAAPMGGTSDERRCPDLPTPFWQAARRARLDADVTARSPTPQYPRAPAVQSAGAARLAFTSPQAIKDHLRLTLATRQHEVFVVMFLDAQNRLILAEEMFRGTLSRTSVYLRERSSSVP